MRPVDYVERGPSPAARREQRLWRIFSVCLLICQFVALVVYDVGFWWVVLASVTVWGLYTLFWAVFIRARSRRG
ncbi:MAG: hypothetical protein U5O16_23765 [Rhodococcus sp. (in: high G+C Gram-positive bacteria)]|uniref:hypothetical protein n=1 Tax=Rhodococcus sp. TaxID=1831 RepID=UPI002AD73219|nr:hypothetical protein [Rhodococcus sp. (in: high G+C Gram-positive bacteria)]